MWQLYVLGSLIASAGESVVDKFAIASNRKIDSMVATFWRLVFFSLFTALIGLLGFWGGIQLLFAPVVFLVAVAGVINSLFYTYLLRHIEVLGIGAMSYLAPFLFLVIDTNVLHTSFSGQEVFGIVLMVLGGFAFAIDNKTHHFNKAWSPVVWVMFLYSALYVGIEGYAFKYAHAAYGIGSIGFCASYGLAMTAMLLVIVLLQGKSSQLWGRAARSYLPRIAISKAFDAGSTILWTQALVFAAVSQVSAMQSLEPLVLFVATYLAQDVLRLRVEEKFARGRLQWKAAAIALLVFGGILMS
ncbi:MAG TPA: EamA family transporter [Candidatus Paceibacterota bacterium]|nr:EamA family transporter [Candidatus Paceibacterota bacterium]